MRKKVKKNMRRASITLPWEHFVAIEQCNTHYSRSFSIRTLLEGNTKFMKVLREVRDE